MKFFLKKKDADGDWYLSYDEKTFTMFKQIRKEFDTMNQANKYLEKHKRLDKLKAVKEK